MSDSERLTGQMHAVSLLRRVLDDVLSDRRFLIQRSISAIELAEHILAMAASGERDIARLTDAAFRKLGPEG
jgi:hypothetical protein